MYIQSCVQLWADHDPSRKLMAEQQLIIFVNTRKIIEKNPDPLESLIGFLRRNGFTGTKLGCSEGGCGSCTVMMSYFDFEERKVVHQSMNSCLAPACSAHLKHITTIEGLGTSKKMHPAQQVIANANGSQCGFCTPGIVMSLYTELQVNPHPTHQSIEDAFDGNLCRCTGYRPILDGAKSLGCTGDCSICSVTDCKDKDVEDIGKSNDRVKSDDYGVNTSPSATACPFPQELLDHYSTLLAPQTFSYENHEYKWIHAVSRDQLVQLKHEYPQAKIINGNTEVGIEVRFKNQKYPIFINTQEVLELKFMKILDDGVEWGSLTSISKFQSQLQHLIQTRKEYETRGFQALADNIKYFAGRQVRNVSALAGNICTASPISDLNPVFLALGAVLTVQSVRNGVRTIPMSDFFLGYRKTALKEDEVLISIKVSFTTPLEFTSAFKQAKRRDDDIAIVNAGFSILLEQREDDFLVKNACFAYGGMAAFSVIAKSASAHILGKRWSASLIEECYPLLLADMPLNATAPGGQIEFRKTLAQSFLKKFSLRVSHSLSSLLPKFKVSENEVGAIHEISRPLSSGKQVYQESKGEGVAGKAIVHLSATKQVTGEALYTDDIPRMYNELYGVIIGSTVAHGIIENIDISSALKAPGIVGYVSREDIALPDEYHGDPNMIGPVFQDEELFATKEVHCMGQMIGIIVANTEAHARYAAKLVKVTYKQLPALFTIEDAIEAKSFFPIERRLNTGEYDKSPHASSKPPPSLPLSAAKHFVKGIARMSAQEHFYLETNACLCVPGEDGEMEVYASTQQAKETQDFVAHVIGVPYHKVVVRVKRMGGGFGGKESRSVFLSAGLAVAARKFNRPVRGMLTREEDMVITGTRHPFRGEYTVGFTDEGKLVSYELDLYANAGYSYDLSIAVLERSMTHCDNSYKIPNMKLHGRLCKTNTATNTAFRGFGGPQGMMIAEQAITHVASFLRKPVEEIRRLNLYQNGEKTHFDMPLESVFLDRAWNEISESSDFQKRRMDIDDYNKKNKYRKRGITLMPTKFGLAYTARFLNQAGALIHIYTDGSIRLAHGGTEMGQGLHTKMVQVAADAFGVPIELVHLSETRTDYVPNTSATAASVSSDINGMAIKNACDQILERLRPLREASPNIGWKELIKKAYLERINLSANGFYKTPDLTYDWDTNTGRLFSYFTYGAVCTEVEIDTLTGDHIVLSSHMIMDIGTPINPTIDIGQIEGAFTQGMGWCTIEEPLVSPVTGFLLTRGPGLYKIPGFKDIPVDFRVSVMDGVRNTRVIHSSKAVGEPPFFLGASVFFAIRDAVKAARFDLGLTDHFRMDCPATSERVRLACADSIVNRSATPLKTGEKPWGVPL